MNSSFYILHFSFQIKERIAKVVKTVADACGFTAYPIAITDTVTRKVKVVKSERDLNKAIKTFDQKGE